MTSSCRMQRHAGEAKSALELACRLDIYSEPSMVTNTAIICTLGPACVNPAILADMLAAGMRVARLSLAHGTIDEHKASLQSLWEAHTLLRKRESGNVVTPLPGVAVDIRGPTIRVSVVASSPVVMETGARIRVGCHAEGAAAAEGCQLWLNWSDFASSVGPGQAMAIDDGLLYLRVVEVCPADSTVECLVEIGGSLGPDSKGVCLPLLENNGLTDVTERDLQDLKALAGQVDFVMASFVRSAETVRKVRAAVTGALVKEAGGLGPLVVAKICDAKGLRALDEILEEADAVLVARGDLGSELRQEKVFAAQKRIIARCGTTGQASVCATHLLDSMLSKPRPTRAEASDVANAIMDGVDCLMLSAETAVGRYPVEAVRTLAKICREAEAAMHVSRHSAVSLKRQLRGGPGPANPLQGSAMAACEAAIRCHAAAILVAADAAWLPRLVAVYRPPCPILVVSSKAAVCRGLNLWHGLQPLLYDKPPHPNWSIETNRRAKFAASFAHARGLVKPTDLAVLLLAAEKSNYSTSSSDVMAVVPVNRLLETWTEETEVRKDAVENCDEEDEYGVDGMRAESGIAIDPDED